MTNNLTETPIEKVNDGDDYRWKLCKCSECDSVHQCRPFNDFYIRANVKERPAPLVCERCMIQSAHV